MNIDRRGFLLGTAAAATLAARAETKKQLRPLKPGEKRKMGLIGCGNMSRGLLPQFTDPKIGSNVRFVVVCDCDRRRAADRKSYIDKKYGNSDCRITYDFREVIADPELDAVCIVTPDHWHAYMCVEAMKHGKDVYCEKPLTWSVDEARKVIAAQRKYGCILQTGSMQRSWKHFRIAVQMVRGGLIGDVMFVDANYGFDGKFGGPSHPSRFWNDPKNAAKEGAPNPDVDWLMWLGPAKRRPYSDELSPRGMPPSHPMFWRADDDLATGMNGDWGAHHLDIAQWGLGEDAGGPVKVIRSDEPHSTDLYHGGRRQRGMKMVFRKPYGDVVLEHGPFSVCGRGHGWGTVFYGTNGIVAVNRGKLAVWVGTGLVKPTLEVRQQIEKGEFMRDKIVVSTVGPGAMKLGQAERILDEKYADVIAKSGVEVSNQHVRNFCECIETRSLPIAHAGVGGHTSILCQLCNMSYKYDVGFDWDPVKMEFANGTGRGIPLARPGDCNGWKVEV